MGWSYVGRDRDQERAEVLGGLPEGDILAEGRVGSTWYLAVRSQADPETVLAAVVLTGRDDGMFWTKSTDETMGPVEAQAPLKVLEVLSPPLNDFAADWRARCREHHERRRMVARLKDGDRVRFGIPVRFQGGGSYDELVVERVRYGKTRQLLFRTPSRHLVQVRRLAQRTDWEVVE